MAGVMAVLVAAKWVCRWAACSVAQWVVWRAVSKAAPKDVNGVVKTGLPKVEQKVCWSADCLVEQRADWTVSPAAEWSAAQMAVWRDFSWDECLVEPMAACLAVRWVVSLAGC